MALNKLVRLIQEWTQLGDIGFQSVHKELTVTPTSSTSSLTVSVQQSPPTRVESHHRSALWSTVFYLCADYYSLSWKKSLGRSRPGIIGCLCICKQNIHSFITVTQIQADPWKHTVRESFDVQFHWKTAIHSFRGSAEKSFLTHQR